MHLIPDGFLFFKHDRHIDCCESNWLQSGSIV